MILRDYQERAVVNVLAEIENRPILVMPTGAGKTVTGVAIARRHGGRVLWVAHRRELILQAVGAIRAAGEEPGVIMPGYPSEPDKLIQVASVQTLARRGAQTCDLLVIDEAHHASADSYANLDAGHILGLTATPFRLDGAPLKPPFGRIVIGAHVDDLIRRGMLIEPTVYAPPGADLSGVRTVMGDYAQGELAERMKTITGDLIEHWKRLAHGRRTVVFAVNVAHSQQIAEQFAAAGIPAEHIDAGSLNRDQVLARLAAGETRVISNCMILTEGWDLPALEVAVIARPTKSRGLHLQMIGRIMRACPDKAGAIVLDHAGNHLVHGMVTDTMEYNLETLGVIQKSFATPPKCPGCYMLLPPDWEECPECGTQRKREAGIVEVAGDLVEIKEVPKPSFAAQNAVWLALEERRELFGYKPGWTAYRFKMQFGFWPVTAEDPDGKQVLVNPDLKVGRDAVYRDLMKVARRKGYKDGWASVIYKERFGSWPSRELRENTLKLFSSETSSLPA